MSKENTYYSFLKRVETHNKVNVEYSDWEVADFNHGDETYSNANDSNTAPKVTRNNMLYLVQNYKLLQ